LARLRGHMVARPGHWVYADRDAVMVSPESWI
jgi:hypothetical protein